MRSYCTIQFKISETNKCDDNFWGIFGSNMLLLVDNFGHKLVWGTGAPVMGCLVITVLGRGLNLWEELTELLDGGGGAEGRGTEA